MNTLFVKVVDGLATWFGCGLSPKAPGTVGTLGAIPLAYVLAQFDHLTYGAATIAFTVFAILVASFYESGSSDHDSQEFVMDEVAGFLITMALVPFTLVGVVAGFLLFRLFDIWKPFPISWIDRRVPGGVGTVADDVAAGVAANVVLQALMWWQPQIFGLAVGAGVNA
jgi:phosphatidylglycerophosphatase A